MRLKATGRRVGTHRSERTYRGRLTETPEGIVKGEPLGHCSNERGVYLIHGRQLVCVGELHLKSVDCSQQRLDGFLETPPAPSRAVNSFESAGLSRRPRNCAPLDDSKRHGGSSVAPDHEAHSPVFSKDTCAHRPASRSTPLTYGTARDEESIVRPSGQPSGVCPTRGHGVERALDVASVA